MCEMFNLQILSEHLTIWEMRQIQRKCRKLSRQCLKATRAVDFVPPLPMQIDLTIRYFLYYFRFCILSALNYTENDF